MLHDYEAHGDMDDETRDILNLVKTNAVSNDPGVTIGDFKFDRGLNYDWSQRECSLQETPCLKGVLARRSSQLKRCNRMDTFYH